MSSCRATNVKHTKERINEIWGQCSKAAQGLDEMGGEK